MNNEDMGTSLSKLVQSHIKAKDIETLKSLLSSTNEIDVLNMIHQVSVANRTIIFRLLSKDKALFVFERLETGFQQELIRSFTEESAIEIIAELDPDERVQLFEELPAKFVKKMLYSLSPEEREMTSMLLGYKPETAGRIMTPEYVNIKRELTVSDALEIVKEHAREKEMVYTIYITDDSRKLEGVISLRDLWISNPTAKIKDVMQKVVAAVSTDTDQEEAAKLLKQLDWLAVPVVDKENRLVGIVTIDDAVDILEEEATEDILDAAGFADVAGKEADRSRVLTKGSLRKIWLVRLPFLLIALVGGLIAGGIIEGFEEMLEAVVVVAFFIPVILDMGGSVGSQSTTVFARGVVLGHISVKNFFRPLLKEMLVGLSIGIILGAIAAVIIIIWQDIPMLALSVGLALVATMTLAATLGFLTPYVIMKLKMDQAAGSAPIITSIKDITGLFIYFGLVSLFMGPYLESNYEIIGQFVNSDGLYFFIDLEEEKAIVLGREDYNFDTAIPEEITVDGETFPVTGIEDGALTEIGNNIFITNYMLSTGIDVNGLLQ